MLRITAGEYRGRRLAVPAVAATRPLVERAREGLMNHLAPLLPEAVVWDIYAGSGILGFEALSRGAARVVAVERDRRAVQQIEVAAVDLQLVDRIRVLRNDVFRLPAMAAQGALGDPPDLLFFDPPYAEVSSGGAPRQRVWQLFLDLCSGLTENGCGVIHTPRGALQEEEIAQLPGIVRRDYGSTSLYWWHRSEE